MRDCPNCIRLTRELREAQETISEYERPQESASAEIHRIRDWLGRPSRIQSAKLLAALLRSPGNVVPNELLAFAMDYDGDRPVNLVLSTHSTYLRRSLERRGMPRSIQSAYGQGRYINANDAHTIKSAIESLNQ